MPHVWQSICDGCFNRAVFLYVFYCIFMLCFINCMVMRKTFLVISLLALMCTSCSVQKKVAERRTMPVVRVGATLEDYMPLLENAGYMAYAFDISGLLDTMYTIKVQVREFEDGKVGQPPTGLSVSAERWNCLPTCPHPCLDAVLTTIS